MFGPGRPAAKPNITAVRPLTQAEVDNYKPDPASNRVKQIRDSHHRVARLMALGLRNFEIAEETGYNTVRISHFRKDPAFQELVNHYRSVEDEAFIAGRDNYYEDVISNRKLSAAEINDRLQTKADEFTIAQLVAIHADAADRTGYPKRTVATNINVDFAARLDRAVERTMKVIDHEPTPAISSPSHHRALDGGGPGEHHQAPRLEGVPPELIKRRA